jgi:hypothetical protein
MHFALPISTYSVEDWAVQVSASTLAGANTANDFRAVLDGLL